MTRFPSRAARALAPALPLAALLVLVASVLPPARAASSAASSASDSASTSVGSLSTSLGRSSDSSRPARVAAGAYRIVEIAELRDRPALLQLTLRAEPGSASADDDELLLRLPREAVAQGRLLRGELVAARPRPYGIEFARHDSGTAFFLVLADDWHRELDSQPVSL